MKTERAPRNRTLVLGENEQMKLSCSLQALSFPATPDQLLDQVFTQDLFEALGFLPHQFVDLLILDPPYNLAKNFNGRAFKRHSIEDYTNWMASWFEPLSRVLKNSASIYICGDWLTSASVFQLLHKRFSIRNRITWEREKGRGAKTNWKNCSEDIWFATVSDDYHFDPEAVMLKRRVIAPYRVDGVPKDWSAETNGNFRLTHASNFWSDITVPFWSMPENTGHPAQKPEKLIAKLILASSVPGSVVLDPFLGSGTTAVVCTKLNRRFVGFEIDPAYSILALKRISSARADKAIQGYSSGCFWERNTLAQQVRAAGGSHSEPCA